MQTQPRISIRALPSDLGVRALAAPLPGAVAVVDDSDGGEALRCCLRDSRPGEQLVLISVAPPGPEGVYAERGPVFVHAEDCGGPAEPGYPLDWRRRNQVFRAYGQDGTIVGGELVMAGAGQEAVAERLLANPTVAFVQTRNVLYGCYMATIERG